jgi:hypothetical protein
MPDGLRWWSNPRLDRRIAAAMPVIITSIVRPRSEESTEQCQGYVERAIRGIAPRDERLYRAPWRESEARKGLLTAAAKVRQALEAIPPQFWTWRLGEHGEDAIKQFIKELEEEASYIPIRRSGGSDRSRIEKMRKVQSARDAIFILSVWGTARNRSRKVQLHLAQVLYKAATGRSSDLRRAVDAMRRPREDRRRLV